MTSAQDPHDAFSATSETGGDRGAQFSSYLASAFAAATRSDNVVTQTTLADASIPLPTNVSETFPADDAADAAITTSAANAGTTLATQTSRSGGSAGEQTSAPQNAQSYPPSTSDADGGKGGRLSHGQLAAAIVVPILVVGAAVLLALLVFRRRRRSKARALPPRSPDTSSTHSRPSAAGFFGWREKWGSLKSSSSSHKDAASEARSPHAHNTYRIARTISHTEPPPYLVDDTAHPMPPMAMATTMALPQLQIPPTPPHHRPQPIPDPSPISPLSATPLRSPQPAFLQTARRGSNAASINSDVYSDTASIHSARAARMSVGGAAMIQPLRTTSPNSESPDRPSPGHDRGAGSIGSGDPFGDARRANTPSVEGIGSPMADMRKEEG